MTTITILSGLPSKGCDMAGCDGQGEAVSASGIVYLCADCRALVAEMTAEVSA